MYDLNDLLYLMARLRDPVSGCPWDLKQSYKTIVTHTLEEAYEVAEAINKGNKTELKEELGDLLFQVVFYAQLGKEESVFAFDDIVSAIVQKLLRRHPHVFPDQNLRASFPEGTTFSDEEIKQQWERIKQEERAQKKQNEPSELERRPQFLAERDSLLSDIPNTFPTLLRAEKLQKRASQHGFDWQSIPPVLDKLEEELQELKAEMKKFSGESLRSEEAHARLKDEMGDVLFSCVNLSRFLNVNPDDALRSTNDKFQQRFQFIERMLNEQGRTVDDASLAELDALWERAK